MYAILHVSCYMLTSVCVILTRILYLLSSYIYCHVVFVVMLYLLSSYICCHVVFIVMLYLLSCYIYCHVIFIVMLYLLSCYICCIYCLCGPQVESLFLGNADAMRRQILPALASHLRAGGRDPADVKLLDVASGTGRFVSFVLDNFPTLDTTVLDLSPFYLAECRRLLGKYEGNVRFVEAAVEGLPFEDETFDAVTCVYLFHELPRDVRLQVCVMCDMCDMLEMCECGMCGGICAMCDMFGKCGIPSTNYYICTHPYLSLCPFTHPPPPGHQRIRPRTETRRQAVLRGLRPAGGGALRAGAGGLHHHRARALLPGLHGERPTRPVRGGGAEGGGERGQLGVQVRHLCEGIAAHCRVWGGSSTRLFRCEVRFVKLLIRLLLYYFCKCSLFDVMCIV